MTAGYAGLFKTRHVPSLVVSSVMARMPLGSSVMLIVLLVNAQYGASAAGTATALMTGAMAVCAPMLGKLIDRGRAPVALVALGVVRDWLGCCHAIPGSIADGLGIGFACGRGQSARGWHHALAVEFHRVG